MNTATIDHRARLLQSCSRCFLASILSLLLGAHLASAQQGGADTTQRRDTAGSSTQRRDTTAGASNARDTTMRGAATPAGGTAGQTAGSAAATAPQVPVFKRLRAVADDIRGVIAGGTVTLELSKTPIGIPNVIIANRDTAYMLDTAAVVDSSLIVKIPSHVSRGAYRVYVYSRIDTALALLERPQRLWVESPWLIALCTILPIAAVIFLLWWIMRKYRTSPGEERHNWIAMLLIEPRNNTYSLSRAQFVFWTAILAASYIFIFISHGLVQGDWGYPPLAGFAWTFLISLGTLLVAQGTSTVKGAKGAGRVNPSPADLFVHGGVIALERVQQVLWTVIAAGLFIFILIKNYTDAETFPTIPDQLLYLMGLSSAGYLTGKAIRKPGPIIDQVAVKGNMLSLTGEHLSVDAFVWVNGAQLPGNAAPVIPDPDDPTEFAKEIQIALPGTLSTPAVWGGEPREILVVNADGQRAEWDSIPAIVKVDPPTAGNGNVLTVTTAYASPNTVWTVNGAATQMTRVANTPNAWSFTYGQPQDITAIIMNSSGVIVKYPAA